MSQYIHFPRAYLLPHFTKHLFISRSPRLIRIRKGEIEGRRVDRAARDKRFAETETSSISATIADVFDAFLQPDERRCLSPLT